MIDAEGCFHSDPVFVSDEQIYCATYGAMMARQVSDHMDAGIGALTSAIMDRFSEEANSIALLALDSAKRCREVEPGQSIGNTTCPSCGASLEIEYGDEEGQLAAIVGRTK